MAWRLVRCSPGGVVLYLHADGWRALTQRPADGALTFANKLAARAAGLRAQAKIREQDSLAVVLMAHDLSGRGWEKV